MTTSTTTTEDAISDPTPEAVDNTSTTPDPSDSVSPASVEEVQQADTPEEPDTFPREYVEKLRQENGKYRQRAQQADELAHRLHVELVRATGKLADPTDLAFDPDHLADADNMVRAIEELLTAKPHLASRRVTGDIGQGPAKSSGTVDLAAILRAGAG